MSDANQDPVAQQVEWGALEATRGSNFRTHRIAKSPDRWAFKPTPGVYTMLVVAWTFAAFGLLLGLLTIGRLPWWGTFVAIGMGTFFGAAGMILLRRIERPFFDLRAKRFCTEPLDEGVPFAELHAVQMAPHRVEAPNERDRYWSCELNLVHHDASRTRILSHGNVAALRLDAAEIANLLGVPLWDRTATS